MTIAQQLEQRGFQQGFQLGLQKGELKAKRAITETLLKDGHCIEFIEKITQLAHHAILALKEELTH